MALTDAQLRNARAIVAGVKAHDMPKRCAVIAIETALTEANLLMIASANVPESMKFDHDFWGGSSDGLGHDHASMNFFQQQTGWAWTPANNGKAVSPDVATLEQSTMPSRNGWGTPKQLMNPTIATSNFLRDLAKIDWPNMENWEAAQSVQGSAFPDRYRDQDARAQRIVDQLWEEDDVSAEDVWNFKMTNPVTGEMATMASFVVNAYIDSRTSMLLARQLAKREADEHTKIDKILADAEALKAKLHP